MLEAARELLVEEGPDAVTPVRIAERTGIARTTIYRHWPDRTALLADVAGREPEPAAVEPSGDLRADLADLLRRVGRRIASRPGGPILAALIAHAHHEPELADLQRDRARQRMQPIVDLVAAYIDRGDLDADLDPEEAVVILGGPLFFQRFFRRKPVSDAFVDAVVDTFVRAYGT